MNGAVTCPEPLAAQAGAEMLRRGGNAVDAAVATAIAQGIANPMMTGIGGSLSAVVRDGRTGDASYVSSTGCAPGASRPDQWQGEIRRHGTTWRVSEDRNLMGYQAQLVPGFLRGAEALFTRFGSGRVRWPELFEPAIALAEEGFEVEEWLEDLWRPGGRVSTAMGVEDPASYFRTTDAAAAIYAPEGRTLRKGERLVQRDYAATLRKIASGGADVFYEGEIAEAIAEDFAAHDGLLSLQDLKAFRAEVVPALEGTYRGYRVFGSHAPSLGPITQEMLNVLEGFDLEELGFGTPAYFDLLSRVMQLAFADRIRYMADPAEFDVPVDRLTSKAYAEELRAALAEGTDRERVEAAAPAPGFTSSMTAMDDEGTAVAIVHSVNVSSGVVTPGLGFLYNSHMWMFNPEPGFRNSIAPGRVPIGGSTASVFADEDGPALTLSSPAGSRGASACLQVALGVLEFGLDPQDATEAPRIHSEDQAGRIWVDDGITSDVRASLEAEGHETILNPYLGVVSCVGRGLQPGSDPRWGGGRVRVIEG